MNTQQLNLKRLYEISIFSIRRSPFLFLSLIVLGALSSFVEAFGISILVPVFLEGATTTGLLGEVTKMFPEIYSGDVRERLIFCAWTLLVIAVLTFSVRSLSAFVNARLAQIVSISFAKEIYGKYWDIPFADTQKNDIPYYRELLLNYGPSCGTVAQSMALALTGLLQAGVFLVVLYNVSPVLSISTIFAILVICVLIALLFRRSLYSFSRMDNIFSQQLTRSIFGVLKANALFRVMGLQSYIVGKGELEFTKFLNNRALMSTISGIYPHAITFGAMIVLSMCFYMISVLESALNMAAVATFVLLATRLLGPVSVVNVALSNLYNRMHAFEEVKLFLDQPVSASSSLSLKDLNKLAVDDVSYHFQGSAKGIKNVSFTFEAGKIYAIVGASGAGKTTLLTLILGLVTPKSGAVKCNQDEMMLDYNTSGLFAYVPQTPFMLSESIAENLRFGRDLSIEKLKHAAQISNVHQQIEEMTESYETLLVDGGNNVSGGQQQRIALARAISGGAKLIALDEVTSALDRKSIALITAALQSLKRDKIVIAVTHDQLVAAEADTVLYMHDGALKDVGSHAHLLFENSDYRELWAHS